MLAVVHGSEHIVGRQDGLSVATSEVDGAGVSGRGIAVGILGGDSEVVGHAGCRGRWEAGNNQTAGGRRVDKDARLRAGDRIGDSVSGGQRVVAGGVRSSTVGEGRL